MAGNPVVLSSNEAAKADKAGGRIRTPKTFEVVADQIRSQIVRGELKEGDTLPPEGQLMTSLGVSRPTLREAYRILEAENLISVRRGSRSGAVVHRPRVDVAARYAGYILQSQGTTVADLYASQMAIEPFVVRSLCREKNNKRAVEALRAHTDVLTDLVEKEDIQAFSRGIAGFHSLLVELTGNKTLSLINNLLQNLLVTHKHARMQRDPVGAEARKARIRGALKSFRKLIRHIENKEEEAAVAHWRLHLKNAHAVWAGPGEGERIVDALDS